jgi:hypothetical protein
MRTPQRYCGFQRFLEPKRLWGTNSDYVAGPDPGNPGKDGKPLGITKVLPPTGGCWWVGGCAGVPLSTDGSTTVGGVATVVGAAGVV